MSAATLPVTPPRKTLLDRMLSPFSRVEAGEGAGALILAANVFLLLAAYYVLKTVREALILSEAGAVVKSQASGAQAVLLLIFIPMYGWFGSRVGRVTLVCGSTIFFISHLAVFFFLGQAGVKIGVPFYIWLGVFNMFVVAQFWAFANDLYSEEAGKRLFPIIGVGASLGAWIGAQAVGRGFKVMTPYQLMGITVGILIGCLGLTVAAHWRESQRQGEKESKKAKEPLEKSGGFELVLRSPYLRWIAILVLLLNVVNTTGEFLLGSLVEREAEQRFGTGDDTEKQRGAFIGQFYGDYFGWVNLIGFLIQTFLVSRIFRWIGVRGALFVLPVIALGGYGLMAFAPVIAAVRVAKILENSTDYSLYNTVRHALFLNTAREEKYKAKAAIDSFFVRAGDVLQVGVVMAGTALGWATSHFAVLNLGFVLVWLFVAWRIFEAYGRQEAARPQTAEVKR